MLGFTAFNAIRALTSEKTAARVANSIYENWGIFERPGLYWLSNAAGHWLEQETHYQHCRDCYDFVINEEYPTTCSRCQRFREEEAQFASDQEDFERECREWKAEQEVLDDLNALDRLGDMLCETTVAQIEMMTMSDASFQVWLDQVMPDLPVERREFLIEEFRSGRLHPTEN